MQKSLVNMSENASSGEDATSLSKIFKELTKLERDFRYQETFYKIKMEELDKATSTNKILKEHLETAYAEIETLRNNIQMLEEKFNRLELDCNHEKEFCDGVVQKLTEKITTMSTEHKCTMEKQEALSKKLRADLQIQHNLDVNELQRNHAEALLEVEQELQRETSHSKQLQTKLDYTMEDNLLLQDKLRKLHAEYLPLEAYKTQLKSLTGSNDKLKAQVAQYKSEAQSLANDNAHLQKHTERLNQFVTTCSDQLLEREAEKTAQQTLIGQVQTQLAEVIIQYDLLKLEVKHLRDEKTNLAEQLETFKGDFCNVEMHRTISQQNQILQELVKEMRRERMKGSSEEMQSNLNETEERIKRLEELIHELKQVLVGKGPLKHRLNKLDRIGLTK